jgi:hypothetical protein
MDTGTAVVFLAVVSARFLVPLLIPRFPLPAILAALVLDGVDQSIFQAFGYDPPGYQGYDKAMDVYYQAIAYLTTLRNWTSAPAVGVARFLYFYRLVGVVAFETTQWRALLLIFPNTFEYYFIAYEIVRLFWRPERCDRRFWVITAAAIWIFVKLPQEYWIHVAQLDFTDELAAHPWMGPTIVAAAVVVGLIFWYAVRPRLPDRDWSWRVAADPLPAEMDTAAQRDRWVAAHGRLMSANTLEKVVLVGLISVIYASVLPGLDASGVDVFLGVTVFVVVNAAVSLWAARGARGVDSIMAAFALRVLLNIGLVVLSDWLLGREGDNLNRDHALFFVLLLSLLTMLDDRYRPVHQYRFGGRRDHARPADWPTVSTG